MSFKKKVELELQRGREEREWFLLFGRTVQVGSRFGFTNLTVPPA